LEKGKLIMRLSFKLLDSSKDIQQKILSAILPEITSLMNKATLKLKQNLPDIIRNAIINTPEYESLSIGKLKYEFGIANVDSKLSSLLNVWSTNISYQYQAPIVTGSRIKSSFSASMIKADFSDVLYADFAAVVDTVRGYTLPWLEWLLLEGNKTIVKNYEVVFGANKFSRTGFAVMQPSRRSWRVPPEFSGTSRDNWITRAIDNAEPIIQKLLDEAFL
jgi:hypothetical protein